MRLCCALVFAICILPLFGAPRADDKLGAPLTLTSQTAIAELVAKPARFVGRTVQVKGKVSEVCQMAGCWMMLTDTATNAAVRIKVEDGEIVFPKDAVRKQAIAEGTFTILKLTHEQVVQQARHEAEEKHRSFDPASVKGPLTIYQIKGSGAVILE